MIGKNPLFGEKQIIYDIFNPSEKPRGTLP